MFHAYDDPFAQPFFSSSSSSSPPPLPPYNVPPPHQDVASSYSSYAPDELYFPTRPQPSYSYMNDYSLDSPTSKKTLPAADADPFHESAFLEGAGVGGRVGRYSAEERKERIERYRSKRGQRNFQKKITYACRKTLADSRPRVRGRFAKNGEATGEQEVDGDTAASGDSEGSVPWYNWNESVGNAALTATAGTTAEDVDYCYGDEKWAAEILDEDFSSLTMNNTIFPYGP